MNNKSKSILLAITTIGICAICATLLVTFPTEASAQPVQPSTNTRHVVLGDYMHRLTQNDIDFVYSGITEWNGKYTLNIIFIDTSHGWDSGGASNIYISNIHKGMSFQLKGASITILDYGSNGDWMDFSITA
jgi:hypothetical protein